jgi:hypothetical protein
VAFAADSGSPVAIITAKLARRLFHDAAPFGLRIVLPARTRARPARELTVVGVTPDVHWHEVSGDADLVL